MEDRNDSLRRAEDLAKNVLGLSATTALEVLGLSEKEAASAMAISGAVDKALATATTEAAVQTIRVAESLAFLELRKAEETAVAVLETAEVEAIKVLAKASIKAVNILAMAETMLAYARGQLESSVQDAALMLKASEELSASELLIVEDFDAHSLRDAQKDLIVHMKFTIDRADCIKKENFEQCARDLKESRRMKAVMLKQHQADTALNLLRVTGK